MNAKTEKKYRYIALVFAIFTLWVTSEMVRYVVWEFQLDPDSWPRVTGELTGCDEETFSSGMLSSRTVVSLYVKGQGKEEHYRYQLRPGFAEKVRELCRQGGSVELVYYFPKGNQTDRLIGSLSSKEQGVVFTAQDTLARIHSTGDLISWFLLIVSFLIGAVWAFLIFLGKARISK
ncbi:MAG TPA: hypothetical protein VIQ22_05440 [Gammaproteobacteria bacterium]